jgi:hypothetical protein
VTRVRPSKKCSECGRTIAIKNEHAAYIAREFQMQAVVPSVLRAHKCSHGNWCGECEKCSRITPAAKADGQNRKAV